MDSISISEAYAQFCKCRGNNLSLDSLADFIQDSKLDYYFYFEGYIAEIAFLDSTLQESCIKGQTLRYYEGYLKPFGSIRSIVISPNHELSTSIALINNQPVALFNNDLDKDETLSHIQKEVSYEINSIYESLSQTRLMQEKLLLKSEDFNEILNIELNELKKTILLLQNQLTEQSALNAELQNKLNEHSLITNEILLPEKEVPHTRTRNQVVKLIHVLCHMNKLPIQKPQVCFAAIKAHADLNDLSCPEKDFTGNWIKKIHSI